MSTVLIYSVPSYRFLQRSRGSAVNTLFCLGVLNNHILYLLMRRVQPSTVFFNACVGDGDSGGNGEN